MGGVTPSAVEGKRVGPYTLRRPLGEGTTATVWLAEVRHAVHDMHRGDEVAIKILNERWQSDAQVRARFMREAESCRRVLHPNVVRVLDAGIDATQGVTRCYIAMQRVQGQTLRKLLDESGAQPEPLCRHVGLELARALAAVHGAGLVHRDLKPSNVALTPDGQVRLMDLGLAHVRDSALRLTKSGDFLGTMLYAAPEQFHAAAGGIDGRADLYALGWVLYELSTGTHPYSSSTLPGVLLHQMRQVPPRVGEIHPGLSPSSKNSWRPCSQKTRRRDPRTPAPWPASWRRQRVPRGGHGAARRSGACLPSVCGPLRRTQRPWWVGNTLGGCSRRLGLGPWRGVGAPYSCSGKLASGRAAWFENS